MMITPKDVGGRIRALMREQNISVKTLARDVQCNPKTIYAYINGYIFPNMFTGCYIAWRLHTTVEYLAFGIGNKYKEEYLVFGEEEKTWE